MLQLIQLLNTKIKIHIIVKSLPAETNETGLAFIGGGWLILTGLVRWYSMLSTLQESVPVLSGSLQLQITHFLAASLTLSAPLGTVRQYYWTISDFQKSGEFAELAQFPMRSDSG